MMSAQALEREIRDLILAAMRGGLDGEEVMIVLTKLAAAMLTTGAPDDPEEENT